jgi:hypothetical protein
MPGDLVDDMTLPLEARVEIWRRRSIEGTITPEDTAKAIDAMRQGRVGAAHAAKAKAVSKAPVDGGALLEKLKAMGAKNAGETGV